MDKRVEIFTNDVLSLIDNKCKIVDKSLEAGPFSTIGLRFSCNSKLKEDYKLYCEYNHVEVERKYWFNKITIELQFFLYNYSLDKTMQIPKENFDLICKELKKIDTDTVEFFLDKVEKNS